MGKQHEPLRGLGSIPDQIGEGSGRVRSTLKPHHIFLQYLGSLMVVGGFVAGGLWMMNQGIRNWNEPNRQNLFYSGVGFLGLSVFMAYLGGRDVYLWVELDGEDVRAKHFYTRWETCRPVAEIKEVRTNILTRRSDISVKFTESLQGQIRGFVIRFPGHRTGVCLYSPEITQVKELFEAVLEAMRRKGKVVPVIIKYQGRPIVRRIVWEDRQ